MSSANRREVGVPPFRLIQLMPILTLILLMPSVGATALAAGADHLVIVQPGYPGSTADATAFVADLCATLRAGGAGISGGEYHNDEKAALEAIARRRPGAGIVSLGFYLEHRRDLSLRAHLWSRPDEPFHVVVRKGTIARLEDLAGKEVTGTPFVESAFVERILFGRGKKGGPPAWKAQPTRLFSKAIRDVTRKRRDAVLLSDREYRGMKKLRAASELERIHTTSPLPVALVVSFGDRLPEGDVSGLQKAVTALGRSAAGRELLETMGIQGFGAIDRKRLGALEELYEKDVER